MSKDFFLEFMSFLMRKDNSQNTISARVEYNKLLKSKELRSFSEINKIVTFFWTAICFLIGIPQVFPFHTHLEGNKKYPRISWRILEDGFRYDNLLTFLLDFIMSKIPFHILIKSGVRTFLHFFHIIKSRRIDRYTKSINHFIGLRL